MYTLFINRSNILLDILPNEPRFIHIHPISGLVLGCDKSEGTGVIGSDDNTHYPLIQSDTTNNPNAVFLLERESLPEDCTPNNWIYNPETGDLQPRYSTGAEKREHAYETLPIIEWQEDTITVDAGNKLWSAYTAEGKVETAQELTALISNAKQEIRAMYPDENEA